MKGKNFSVIFTLITLILLSSCNNSIYAQTDIDMDNALVKVNGDYIMKSDIDQVYEQFNGAVSYKKIVENSILEMLVVQASADYGIKIKKKQLDEILSEFEQNYSDTYKEAVEQNGIDNLRKKLEIRNTYSMTKEYVMDNILLKDKTIPHDVIEKFKEENGLVEQLAPYSDEQIIQNLSKELEEYMFREWMLELRDKADIEYLKEIPNP